MTYANSTVYTAWSSFGCCSLAYSSYMSY